MSGLKRTTPANQAHALPTRLQDMVSSTDMYSGFVFCFWCGDAGCGSGVAGPLGRVPQLPSANAQSVSTESEKAHRGAHPCRRHRPAFVWLVPMEYGLCKSKPSVARTEDGFQYLCRMWVCELRQKILFGTTRPWVQLYVPQHESLTRRMDSKENLAQSCELAFDPV